jgi:hypothetical protein
MHLAGGSYKEPEEGIQVKHKDATKSAREFMGVRPPTRAQTNNKPKKSSTSLEVECSISSKVRWLRSLQTVHNKHNSTKFQISETDLPKLLNPPYKRSIILFGNTQQTPKDLNTADHRSEAKTQCIKR